jgi:hypothetical protein
MAAAEGAGSVASYAVCDERLTERSGLWPADHFPDVIGLFLVICC